MSMNNLEYNVLMKQSSVPGKQLESVVPATYLVLVLSLTAIITLAELVLAQLTHCISLLVLVHQNIYNTLTLIVSCVTRWKGEEVSAEIFLETKMGSEIDILMTTALLHYEDTGPQKARKARIGGLWALGALSCVFMA